MISKKILIVDDDHIMLNIISGRLQKEGFDVKTVTNGNSAIQTVKEYKPEIIILDIILPDLDGFEICRAIKAEESMSTKVILLTGSLEAINFFKARDVGAEEFVVKNEDCEELIKKVKKHSR